MQKKLLLGKRKDHLTYIELTPEGQICVGFIPFSQNNKYLPELADALEKLRWAFEGVGGESVGCEDSCSKHGAQGRFFTQKQGGLQPAQILQILGDLQLEQILSEPQLHEAIGLFDVQPQPKTDSPPARTP